MIAGSIVPQGRGAILQVRNRAPQGFRHYGASNSTSAFFQRLDQRNLSGSKQKELLCVYYYNRKALFKEDSFCTNYGYGEAQS